MTAKSPGGGNQRWHVSSAALSDWVDGVAGSVVSMSVEQHVATCASCQATVAQRVPSATVAAEWEGVLEEIEKPPAPRTERLLVRLGVRPSDAVVMAAAGTLRTAWFTGMVAMLGFTMVAALLGRDGGVWLFLLVAPLIPVAGVAAVYGPSADPLFEAVQATPYSMIRLALLRTSWVLVTSVPATFAAGLLLPTSTLVTVGWLLPALGFVVAVVTASSWVDPDQAATAVAACWFVAVALAARSGSPADLFDPLALLIYVGLLVVAGGLLVQRLRVSVPSWRLW